MNHVDSPTPLTTALFLTFAFIADTQDSMTSREVDGLNQLLRDTTWSDDKLMRTALDGFSAQYATLWKAYDAGTLNRNGERLAEELARSFRGLSGRLTEAHDLKRFAHSKRHQDSIQNGASIINFIIVLST